MSLSEGQQALERARSSYAAGEFDRAHADFEKAIACDATCARAYVGRGNVCYHRGDLDAAQSDYGIAIQLDPRDAAGYHNRALVFFHSDRFADAVADITFALECEGADRAACLYLRGCCLANLAQFDSAVLDFSQALCYAPDEPTAYLFRGTWLARGGRLEEAVVDLDTSIRRGFYVADSFAWRGYVLSLLGDHARANTSFCVALHIDPENANTYVLYGNAEYHRRRFKTAIVYCEHAIALDPSNVYALSCRGLALAALGRYDEAICNCTEAVVQSPSEADAYYCRALVWYDMGEFNKAIEDLSHSVDLRPYAEAFRRRGQAWFALRDAARARDDFRRAQLLAKGIRE